MVSMQGWFPAEYLFLIYSFMAVNAFGVCCTILVVVLSRHKAHGQCSNSECTANYVYDINTQCQIYQEVLLSGYTNCRNFTTNELDLYLCQEYAFEKCVRGSCSCCCHPQPDRLSLYNCDQAGHSDVQAKCDLARVTQADCYKNCQLNHPADQLSCQQSCQTACYTKVCSLACCPAPPPSSAVVNCGSQTVDYNFCQSLAAQETADFSICATTALDVYDSYACEMKAHQTCLSQSCAECCPNQPRQLPSNVCSNGYALLDIECDLAMSREVTCFEMCQLGDPAQQKSCQIACQTNCINSICDLRCCPCLPAEACISCRDLTINYTQCLTAGNLESLSFASCSSSFASDLSALAVCQEIAHEACLSEACCECCPNVPSSSLIATRNCRDGTYMSENKCLYASLNEVVCFDDCSTNQPANQYQCQTTCHNNCLASVCNATCCSLTPSEAIVVCGGQSLSLASCHLQRTLCQTAFNSCAAQFPANSSKLYACQEQAYLNCTQTACPECCPPVPSSLPMYLCNSTLNWDLSYVCDLAKSKERECMCGCMEVSAPGDMFNYFYCVQKCETTCLASNCETCCPRATEVMTSCGGLSYDACTAKAMSEQFAFLQCRQAYRRDKNLYAFEACQLGAKRACLTGSCQICCPDIVTTPPILNCSGTWVLELICEQADEIRAACFLDCELNSRTVDQYLCQQKCYNTCVSATACGSQCCTAPPTQSYVNCTGTIPHQITSQQCYNITMIEQAAYQLCVVSNQSVDLDAVYACQMDVKRDLLSTYNCPECLTALTSDLELATCSNGEIIMKYRCDLIRAEEEACFNACAANRFNAAQSDCQYYCTLNCKSKTSCDSCCPLEDEFDYVVCRYGVISAPRNNFMCMKYQNDTRSQYNACEQTYSMDIYAAYACEIRRKRELSFHYACPECVKKVPLLDLPVFTCEPALGNDTLLAQCNAAKAQQSACFDECQLTHPLDQRDCQQNCSATCLSSVACASCCPLQASDAMVQCGLHITYNLCQTIKQNYTTVIQACEANFSSSTDAFAAYRVYTCQQAAMRECYASYCDACCPNASVYSHLPERNCSGGGQILDLQCKYALDQETSCFRTCMGTPLPALCRSSCQNICFDTIRTNSCLADCCPPFVPCSKGDRDETVDQCDLARNEESQCTKNCWMNSRRTSSELALCQYDCFQNCTRTNCQECCPYCDPTGGEMPCNPTVSINFAYITRLRYLSCVGDPTYPPTTVSPTTIAPTRTCFLQCQAAVGVNCAIYVCRKR